MLKRLKALLAVRQRGGRTYDQEARRRKQARWTEKWHRRFPWVEAQRSEFWQDFRAPPSVRSSVTDGWFRAGGRLLDIGCGFGELSGWLARAGFPVVGIDFVPEVIDRARAYHAEFGDNPAFHVADICGELPALGSFENAIDIGCLHGIPRAGWSAYAENLRQCLVPGARFLIVRSNRGPEIIRETEAFFARDFEILKIEQEDDLNRYPTQADAGRRQEKRPVAAFWLERR